MPGVDLSQLAVPDLRKLLKRARSEHEGQLADRVEWELAARAAAGGRVTPPPVSGPDADLAEPEPVRVEALPAQRPFAFALAGLTVGIASAVAAMWALGEFDSSPARVSLAPVPRALALQITPKFRPAEPVVPVPVAEPQPLSDAAARPPPAAKPAKAAKPADPCAVWRLPADRIVCANSHLAAMHLAVRKAYDQAIAAHADTEVTGADEAAWLAARDEATDPGRLALLYDRRLRELTAATEAARKRDEPIF